MAVCEEKSYVSEEKTTGVRMSCAGLTVRCSAQVQPYLAPPAQKAVNGSVRRKKLCVGGKNDRRKNVLRRIVVEMPAALERIAGYEIRLRPKIEIL